MTQPTILFLCVFPYVGKCLPSRCLATIGGMHIQTQIYGRIYEIRRWDDLSSYEIYTKTHNNRFGIQKLIEADTQTQRMEVAKVYFRKRAKHCSRTRKNLIYKWVIFNSLKHEFLLSNTKEFSSYLKGKDWFSIFMAKWLSCFGKQSVLILRIIRKTYIHIQWTKFRDLYVRVPGVF
jgi:hypothetical protein